jgi:hypothetical protein
VVSRERFIAGIFTSLAAIIVAFAVGIYLGDACMRQESVKTNHAKWVGDSSGCPKFQWNEK